jgi:hypothetical protein
MATAKDIIVKPIGAKDAKEFVKKNHYSKTVVMNSKLHFGCFLNRKLEGVLSFGSSLDKKKVQGLVRGTGWNDFIELNRMAFSEVLPKNSESRCIGICLRIIKKTYPHIKWVVSFADAQQCGDGTIYRASGFYLTGYSSGAMWKLPDDLAKINGSPVAHRLKVQDKCSKLSKLLMGKSNGKNLTTKEWCRRFGGEVLQGYNFRYIYFLDKECKANLSVPILPFSKINELGAKMYKGELLNKACKVGDEDSNPTATVQH